MFFVWNINGQHEGLTARRSFWRVEARNYHIELLDSIESPGYSVTAGRTVHLIAC